MRGLGTNAYRLSIAWPRVVPGGDGPVNAKGLDFYDQLIDGLLAAGIEPSVTLYHWDLPQALQDRGGWPERATAEHFASYAGVVAERLGDRVTQWATLNEPLCSAWIGHLEGKMAPGWTDLTAAVRASYHLLLGHGLAARAIRAAAPGAQIGIVNNLSTVEPHERQRVRPGRSPADGRPRQPLVARPRPRPRFPHRHAGGLRGRPARAARRPRHHRRPARLDRPELLLPANSRRRPARPRPPRPDDRPARRPAHRNGLGGGRRMAWKP